MFGVNGSRPQRVERKLDCCSGGNWIATVVNRPKAPALYRLDRFLVEPKSERLHDSRGWLPFGIDVNDQNNRSFVLQLTGFIGVAWPDPLQYYRMFHNVRAAH